MSSPGPGVNGLRSSQRPGPDACVHVRVQLIKSSAIHTGAACGPAPLNAEPGASKAPLRSLSLATRRQRDLSEVIAGWHLLSAVAITTPIAVARRGTATERSPGHLPLASTAVMQRPVRCAAAHDRRTHPESEVHGRPGRPQQLILGPKACAPATSQFWHTLPAQECASIKRCLASQLRGRPTLARPALRRRHPLSDVGPPTQSDPCLQTTLKTGSGRYGQRRWWRTMASARSRGLTNEGRAMAATD